MRYMYVSKEGSGVNGGIRGWYIALSVTVIGELVFHVQYIPIRQSPSL